MIMVKLLLLLVFCIGCLAHGSADSNFTGLRKPTTRTPFEPTTTRNIRKTTERPKKCHSFNIFCIPCKIGVNVIRSAMERVVFIHKTVESLCTHILGQHFICDALIKVTMFYLDHTPTENVCKRFFLCGNNGFFDWWNTKSSFPEGSRNFSIWKVLNARNQVWDQSSYNEVKSSIDHFFDEYNSDISVGDLPDGTIHQVVDFILTLGKAAELISA